MLTMEMREGMRGAELTNRKRTVQRNHYTTVKMAPCKICGGKSSGFHFGVITCEACKAFFRRAMINKSTYECTRGAKCSERNGNLIGCSACRLQRCLQAGMSKRGVRKGRYSIALRTQAILDAIATEQEMTCGVINTNPPITTTPLSPTRSWTPFESTPLSPLSSSSLPPVSPASQTSESSLSPPIRATEVNRIVANHGILLACLSAPGEPSYNQACKEAWAKNGRARRRSQTQGLTDEQTRSFDDLIATVVELQKSVYPNYKASVDTHTTLQGDQLAQKQACQYLFGRSYPPTYGDSKHGLVGMNMELDKRLSHFRKIAVETERDIALYINHIQRVPGFSQLDKCDIIKLLKSSYNEFWLFCNYESMNGTSNSSCGTDDVTTARHGTLTPKDHVDAVHRFAEELKKLQLTIEELSIIRVLLLTFTDRSTLKDPAKVQDIHDTFLNCLRQHLNRSYSNPGQRLTKIVDKLVAARSITYMNHAVNEQFLKNWGFLVHEYPLWREMMAFDDGQTVEQCTV